MRVRLFSLTQFSLLSALLWFPARALGQEAEVRTECAEAYEQAQEERSARHFLNAQRELQTCTQESCPEFMQADCSQWLGELEGVTPTMVFAVRTEGEDVSDVRVLLDGKVLVEQLDGSAVAVDPGAHEFTFEHPASKTRVTKRLLAREGEKNRLVTVEIGISRYQHPVIPSHQDSPAEAQSSSRSPLPYALLGVGGLGVVGFAVFGLVGNSRLSQLERSCSPTCSESEVSSLQNKWLLADISLGVGVVSLGAAAYLLITQQNPTKQTANLKVPVNVKVTSSGGFATLDREF